MKTLSRKLRLLLCGLCCAIGMAHAADSAPQLQLTDAKTDAAIPQALLLNMKADGHIDGMLATVRITQTFKNTSNHWVHGTYVFPLPENAAVDDLTFIVNNRKIKGEIKEREQAKQIFEAAKREGKKAALLEQERPNLFTMNIANIPPQAEVKAEIRYVESARYDAGQFSLRLPTTLTPRYIPGEADTAAANSGSGWARDTDQVGDAARITPPQFRAGHLTNSHQYSIDFTLNPGIPLTAVTASQAVNVTENGFSRHISLKNGTARMDEDWVLTWIPAVHNAPQAAAFRQSFNGENYTMLMFVPPVTKTDLNVSRRMVFVIDSSGSMAGESMTQAKAGLKRALTYLRPRDTFNIIDFDDDARKLFARPVAANPHNLSQAERFIDGLDADGGTEIMNALMLATDASQINHDALQQIIFITDGSVGNEGEIFRAISTRLGKQQLFTIGIGSAPNSYFMQKAAQFGRGSYTYINNTDEVAMQLDTLFAKIQSPAVRNLSIDWGGVKVDAYPRHTPDLYYGEPLMITAQSNAPVQQITIKGEQASSGWTRTLNLADGADADNLDSLWGRRKIDEINDSFNLGLIDEENAKQQIVPLAIRHHLMSPFTSFVAVEEKISREKGEAAEEQNVPNLMPQNSAMAAPYPQTATNAGLLQMMGLILLSAAAVLSRRRRSH